MHTRHAVPALVLLSVLVGAAALGGAGVAAAQPANGTAAVSFDDQVGVEEVTVSAATLPEGGYVAVYNASGGLVGTSDYLGAGSHENVTVAVSPALARSQVVIAELRTDDGDRSFDAAADAAYGNGTAVSDTAYVATEEFSRTAGTATATGTAAGDATETSGPGFTGAAALVALVGLAAVAIARGDD